MSKGSVIYFLTDNNVPDSVGRALEAVGHSVVRVRDIMPNDSPDPIVAQAAISASRILITWDRDFNHQRFQQPRFRLLSRIGFSCPEPEGARRIVKVIDLVEFSIKRAKGEAVVILVGKDKFMIRT